MTKTSDHTIGWLAGCLQSVFLYIHVIVIVMIVFLIGCSNLLDYNRVQNYKCDTFLADIKN